MIIKMTPGTSYQLSDLALVAVSVSESTPSSPFNGSFSSNVCSSLRPDSGSELRPLFQGCRVDSENSTYSRPLPVSIADVSMNTFFQASIVCCNIWKIIEDSVENGEKDTKLLTFPWVSMPTIKGEMNPGIPPIMPLTPSTIPA